MTAIEPTGRQARRVLTMLRQSYPGWACLRDFGNDSHVARNRISEMKSAGWAIEVRRCRRHDHEGQIAEYRLVQKEGEGKDFTTARRRLTTEDEKPGAGAPIASAPLFPEPFVRRGNAL